MLARQWCLPVCSVAPMGGVAMGRTGVGVFVDDNALTVSISRLRKRLADAGLADFIDTILLVTHDAFAASYCKRVLFIKDGNLYAELLAYRMLTRVSGA